MGFSESCFFGCLLSTLEQNMNSGYKKELRKGESYAKQRNMGKDFVNPNVSITYGDVAKCECVVGGII